MATFQYMAYNAQGAVISGRIVAEGVEAAIDAIYGSGLTPFKTFKTSDESEQPASPSFAEVDEAARPFWKRDIFASDRFSLKDLTAFTVELSSLINSGLPLDAACRIIAGPGAAPKTVRLANGLLKDVLAGAQLSEAMARHPEIFPLTTGPFWPRARPEE